MIKYYTIAGNWIPNWTFTDPNCTDDVDLLVKQWVGYSQILGSNDGIVPVKSVESHGFNSLGRPNHCHTNLLGDEEYQLARGVLLTPQ